MPSPAWGIPEVMGEMPGWGGVWERLISGDMILQSSFPSEKLISVVWTSTVISEEHQAQPIGWQP